MTKSLFTLIQDPHVASLRASIDRAIHHAKSNGVDDKEIDRLLAGIINYRKFIRGEFK